MVLPLKGKSHEDHYAAIDPDSTVIFVMNNRSNMDYVLVTYVAAFSMFLPNLLLHG